MTIMCECDRCHALAISPLNWLEVRVDCEVKSIWSASVLPRTYHYCPKCTTIILDAIAITNDGTYDGKVKE